MDYNNVMNIKSIKSRIRRRKRTSYLLFADAITILVIAIVLIAGKSPGNVSGLKVTETTYDTATIKWNEAKFADGYRIYRSEKGKEYEYITSTGDNNYTDKNLRTGTEYNYKVVSRKAFKSNSLNKTAHVKAQPHLETPELKVETSKGIIELSYSNVDGAIAYEILRDGKTIGESNDIKYIDESAKGDEPYKYEVKAVRYKKAPVYSKPSNKVSAELHAIQGFRVEPMGDELAFEWTASDHYDNYKLFNGEELLTETTDSLYRMSEYDIDKIFDIRLVGYNTEDNTQSPGATKRFKVLEEPMDNEGARAAACEWGVEIANDDSFTYGTGSRSHRYGCYFCGTNRGIKGSGYEKTYCCNPFVHACYSHGAGDEAMLAVCRAGKGLGHSEGSFTRYGTWKSVGRPSISDLEMGDVLTGSGHMMLYIGDGMIVHAKSEGWGADTICTDPASRFYGMVDFVMRYTGTGSGTMRAVRDVDENGKVIEQKTDDSANESEENSHEAA